MIELKRSTVGVGEGIRQTLDNQDPRFIRHFFTTVQMCFAGNDSEGLRYAAIQTPQPYWLAWKEESEIINRLDRDITQMMAPERFLELVHDFTLFDAGTKKIARPNQYFAVKATQDRVRDREGGIIWQTQGSGKSLIMVMLARWIQEHNPDARVLIITDRKELDQQIVNQVFGGTGDKVRRAKSGADLMDALASPEDRVVCSLVRQIKSGHGTDYPDEISTPGCKALYDNLDQDIKQTLELDRAVRTTAQAGWRGNRMKERKVLRALEDILGSAEMSQEVLDLVREHDEY
ncbi:DEAD/DEAH box helicase family protein [Roseovarius sp. E0-M6]|uniref:DEAD/DEAH box helicase family protein n=1 Tax=Roseovarius sp. E0-M6 TaxID=3127118 RepID=UPI00300F93B1